MLAAENFTALCIVKQVHKWIVDRGQFIEHQARKMPDWSSSNIEYIRVFLYTDLMDFLNPGAWKTNLLLIIFGEK